MKICQSHWDMMRVAIDEAGLSGMVAKSGEAAFENIEEELSGGEPPFDPLMSMHWHFSNLALEYGGLYLMGMKEDGSDHCPLCEFETHNKAFVPKDEIHSVARQMCAYAIEQGLIPGCH